MCGETCGLPELVFFKLVQLVSGVHNSKQTRAEYRRSDEVSSDLEKCHTSGVTRGRYNERVIMNLTPHAGRDPLEGS